MLPVDPKVIKSKFREAQALQKSGKLPAARSLFEDIARARDDIPEVHFQLGEIARALGEVDTAICLLREGARVETGRTGHPETTFRAFVRAWGFRYSRRTRSRH